MADLTMDPMDEDGRKSVSPPGKTSSSNAKSTRRKSRSTAEGFQNSNETSDSTSSLCERSALINMTSSMADDPAIFGQLVTFKLRYLSPRNAIMAQADIIAILQKYVLAELDNL